jgi:spore coat protein CotH
MFFELVRLGFRRPAPVWPIAVTAAALFLGLVDRTSVSAQTADDLFDPRTLQEIRLAVNAQDLQLLHQNFADNTYYPADLVWRDQRVRNIGIRSRGSGSRNGTKLGLKLDFNNYVDGQKFLGFKDLVLDNLWQDPAMLRERTSMALFARLGLPAPREAFVRLYINDAYQGLYAIVEPVDKDFLKRTTGEDEGYLFEYEWTFNFYGEDLGDDLAPYKALFSPETHEDEPDFALYRDIRFLFREVNAQEDAGWEDRVDDFLDLKQFVTQAAIEAYLSELDGLIGGWGMNNFYLYRPGTSRQHRVFPWDKDNTFQSAESSVLLRAEENHILKRALERDDLRAVYLQTLENCAQASLQDDWLAQEIAITADLVTPSAHEDTLKPVTNAQYDAGIQSLKDFAATRPLFVLQQIAVLRGEVAPPESSVP